jgi:AGCS family alanine or glycine:cation symporter
LTVAVILFAFSTMISWSYYGLKAWTYLFGESMATDVTYKVLFLFFIVVGSSMSLGSVINFSDAMIFAMAFPNILGLYFLLPVVKKELNEYWAEYKAGELKKYGKAATRS